MGTSIRCCASCLIAIPYLNEAVGESGSSAMATNGEQYQTLHNFLKDSFLPADFRMFLTFQGEGLAEVAAAVDTEVGGTRYFFEVVGALNRKGLINAEFFDRVSKELPAKQAQLKSVEEIWLKGARNGSDASARVMASDPRKVVPAGPATPGPQSPAAPSTSFVPGCTHDIFVSYAEVDDL